MDQNSPSSPYADTISIISFSFLKCLTYFPLRGLFKVNFKLPCISAYANLKFLLSLMASFTFFSSSIRNLDSDGWTFSWILLFNFGFCFLFSVSLFLICLRFKKSFSLKLWVVNLIIFYCLPFFVPPTGWTLSTCITNSSSSSPALLAIAEITRLLSSSFVSSFPGFRRAVTIIHDLR